MTAKEQVEFIIGTFEGDIFTDDPVDLGGATRYGITLRTLQHYRRQKTGNPALEVTVDDVKNLTLGEAFDCGYVVFVVESGLVYILDDAVRLSALDYAFHSGWVPAIKALQTAVGVTVDGILGPITADAINRADPMAVVLDICTERQVRMQKLILKRNDQKRFAFGWWSRVTTIQQKCCFL
jgi:lysozyme family protein